MHTQTIIHCCVICLIFSLTGCHVVKTKFSAEELKWLDVYNPGDTLIFKSDNGKFDTSYILDKKIYYPEYIPLEVHDKYLPQTGVITYKNANAESRIHEGKLIYIYKNYPNRQTRLFITYLNAHVAILDLSLSSIEKYRRNQIYEFDTDRPNARVTEPQRLFWHEKYGLVKYITKDSVTWVRININQ